MEKAKKIKIFIGLFYLVAICLFLYFFFSKFSLQDLTSYDFIKENRSYFFELKNSNLFLTSIIFLLLTILWVFPFLGFGSPVALIGGFIFGKWVGTLIVVLGLSIGATFLYVFGNYFLKDLIREKFLNRFKSLETKFKKSEFTFLLVYRFIGGIPWQLSCLIPTLFNVRVKNFFFATLIGIIPQIFFSSFYW
ncbi:VTT domain-containing protein [Candidatus Pelagibacter bacterium]|nr:VTT domain-containing protein [Candidatus Pelagibacter bacterium]